ncbi:transposase, partial [Blastopirellula marina]
MGGRIADELGGIDLGDKRLNARSAKILEALATNPEVSVNAAHDEWAETQAAYRFFNNENVTPEKILEPHLQATIRRICERPVVLIAQDTTELDFSDHPAKGLRSLNVEARQGLYLHLALALTPDRLPLGVT